MATFVTNALFDGPALPRNLIGILSALGFVLILLGVWAPRSALAALTKVSLVVLSSLLTLAIGELAFRSIGYDFERPHPSHPPFFYRPTVHDGDGTRRRLGPAVWRGKPLSLLVQNFADVKNAYPDEREVEIYYDRTGFRNPPELNDWDVVIVGDSFVESGYLPYEQIFTSVAATRLGVRVKNLGASGTGLVWHTAYLRKYGKAASTRHAVLSFYDGNDVADLSREIQMTNFFHQTGQPFGGNAQVSLIVALKERLLRAKPSMHPPVLRDLGTNAVLVVGDRDYPVTISRTLVPASWERLPNEQQEMVVAALTEWARTARAHGMQPWVMCIPDRIRVFHGYLRCADTNHPLTRWQPEFFGPPLARICTNLNIGFIDPYPALRREMEAGMLTYNLIADGHLTVHGSRIVGEVLAANLGNQLELKKIVTQQPR